MGIELRAAEEADVEPLATIWFEGWDDGHSKDAPEELRRQRTKPDFLSRVAARLDEFRVSVVDDTVAGFVVVAKDELEQIYVDRLHRGSGIASRLLADGEASIASAGFERAWLAVVPGNSRAQTFYRRHGWTDMGKVDYSATLGSGAISLPVHRFEKPVSPGS